MRKIATDASGSTVIDTAVILNAGEEKNVKGEDLVIIDNRITAVCRTALGSNGNLRAVGFSFRVAYGRLGVHPSTAAEGVKPIFLTNRKHKGNLFLLVGKHG